MRRSIFAVICFISLSSAFISLAPISTAPNFLIKANLDSDSSLFAVQGWNLTSYHITPCEDYAVFSDHTGAAFYANGTEEQFTSHTSNILSDGGSPPWPWGTIVNPANATDSEGRRNVLINCAPGTAGLAVKTDESYPGTGHGPRIVYGDGDFYVCNTTFLYGPAIALYYRESEDATPDGCSDVELQTYCLPDQTRHDHQEDSYCYDTTVV